MHGILQDLRLAIRMLRKRPGASLVIVLTLGLGLGINAGFFSSFHAMVLRPLPFDDPDSLVTIYRARPATGETYISGSESDAFDLAATPRLAGLEAYRHEVFNLRTEGLPERAQGAEVSAGLFPLLGVEPAQGRLFTDQEGRPGGAEVVILGDDLWRRSFGADPAIVGRTIRVDGEPVEVVGIMEPGFAFPLTQEMWRPLRLDPAAPSRSPSGLQLIGRLSADSSVAQAQGALEPIMADLLVQYPDDYEEGISVKVRGLHETWMPPVTQVAAVVMQALVSLVLLIVCANVANMVLAQATIRRQEHALRAALGAGSGHLLRQSLVETLMLSSLAGGLGLLIAAWQGDVLQRISPIQIPYWIRFEMSPTIFAFAAALTLGTGIGLGLLPALRRQPRNLSHVLADGGRSDGGTSARDGWVRGALVVGEYALAVIVLVGALLMVHAYEHLRNADTGFAIDERVTLRLSLPDGEDALPRALDVIERGMRAIETMPEVRSVAAVNFLPIANEGYRVARLEVEGQTHVEGQEPAALFQAVSEGYFDTMAIPLRAGRGFTAGEIDEGRAVGVISSGLAERLWPGQDPRGRRVRPTGQASPWLEIVGVVADIDPGEALAGIDQRPKVQLYVPLGASPTGDLSQLSRLPALVVDSAASPAALGPELRRRLATVAPDVPVFHVMSMSEVVRRHYFAQHIWSRMFAFLALAALVIAAVGAYGVSTYAVSRRRREMGIRLALGARPDRLMAAVVSRGMLWAVAGLGLGLLVAVPMANAMADLLHGVELTDPSVFGSVLGLLAAVSLIASIVPARRAAQVDPAITLREG